jgi:hypothetical protein
MLVPQCVPFWHLLIHLSVDNDNHAENALLDLERP